uniref:Fibronectin type III domain-containing protein n=1 Tax=Candidatus Kentrum eta TaxID=2126337 RepID=A0A450UCU2_9GAMM|nr:MAG: Fibronectin type III domain-containing protein [Candidatus Kentron sp. H]VFJ90154.1 MAG: Fibronectin type III domain-containing protein [Candidatus Kentron sp. H]VFJ96517.1 MAG: Fibronectin type III domain-containing protein [Candidatus Kentron sp. H]
MANFPDDEPGILELAKNMVRGLTDNSPTYPSPPMGPLDLEGKIDACEKAKEDVVALQSELKQAFDAKEAAMTDLTDWVKRNLRYAENTVGDDDAKLSMIGWGGRRPPTPLEAPGQVGNLKATEQGDDWITLNWRKPPDGGKVAHYCVECREKGEDDWHLVKTALGTEVTLEAQERGKALEYRVVAVNKAGQGEGSNTVAAVL